MHTKKTWAQLLVGVLVGGLSCLLILVLATVSQGRTIDSAVHLTLGNPSNASTAPWQGNNYLIQRPQYALSYNNNRHIANWASWQLNQSWLGSTKRRNEFLYDDSLPNRWYKVQPTDLQNSGYNRGHLVPSADRTRSRLDNDATFLMTNIIPQAPSNNDGVWRYLEEYSRQLLAQGRELYIIAGGRGEKSRLPASHIIVPDHLWKIIVVLDRPGLGINGITTSTRVIAVDIPNDNYLAGKSLKSYDWKEFLTSVDEIEAVTGYDFLSNVPTSIQSIIEAKVDGNGDALPLPPRQFIPPWSRQPLGNRQAIALAIGTGLVATGTLGAIHWRQKRRPQTQKTSPQTRPQTRPQAQLRQAPSRPGKTPSSPKQPPAPSSIAAYDRLEKATLNKPLAQDVNQTSSPHQVDPDVDWELKFLKSHGNHHPPQPDPKDK